MNALLCDFFISFSHVSQKELKNFPDSDELRRIVQIVWEHLRICTDKWGGRNQALS